MSINERIYQIDQLLNERRGVSFNEMLERLEVSRATLKRDLAYMRDRLQAPIVFDKALNGYRFETQGVSQYELPGLWFSADEIRALLTMNQLLSGLDTGGLLGPHIKPLLSRISALLGSADDSAEQVKKRVKVETIGSRRVQLNDFQVIGSALLKRKRLLIDYYARGNNEVSSREISPQRLIYYRDNWYLDAWCHLRNGLRSFSVDAIKKVELLEAKAEEILDDALDAELGSGYGIFAGQDVQIATLVFSPNRARWLANEKWHPKQEGRFLEDGSYELKVPFSDGRELVMDILKYGPDVEVVSPDALKVEILRKLNEALRRYR